MKEFQFELRDAEALPIWVHRRMFLDAVRETSPNVLEELKAVLPMARSFAELENDFLSSPGNAVGDGVAHEVAIPEDASPGPVPKELDVWNGLLSLVKNVYDQGEPLVEALEAWSEKFRLTDTWILDIAVSTLAAWVHDTEPTGTPEWHFPDVLIQSPLSHSERDFQFADSWNAPFESWESFSNRLDKVIQEKKGTYRSQIEGLLTSRGWNSPSVRHPEKFRWLALYQVKGWSAKTVADRLTLDLQEPASTVTKAVKAAAELIGLTLRQPNQGRAKPS